MTLSAEAKARLADVVSLQPTKNSELQDRWGMESGSEVHGYLESELADYYYRDENSLIRATPEAVDLVDVQPGVEDDEGGTIIRVPELQRQVVSVLAGPEDRSQSVVSVLHDLRDAFGVDSEASEVRSALRSLERKGVVAIEYRSVPTFRLATPRGEITVEAQDQGR